MTISVTYKNILKDIDLYYTISPEKITEDLILRKKSKIKSFTYQYSYGKMKVKAKAGRIEFKVNGKTRFARKKVVVTDALGASTKSVKVTFNKGKLTVTPNQKWMNDKKRKYPITIRSITVTNKYKENIQVAGAYAGTPNKNHTSLPYLQTEANKSIAFAKMAKLPSLGSGAKIRTAQLSINNLNTIQMQVNKTFDVGVYRVTQKWNSLKVTNNKRPSYAGSAENQLSLVKAGRYSTKITDLVKDWYNGTPNYGVALVAANANGSYLAKLDKEPLFIVDYEVLRFQGAKELLENQPLQHSVNVSGQEEYYYFTTQPGIAYELYTTSNLDTQSLLYDEAGNRIGYNDNDGENANFKIIGAYEGKTFLKINTKSTATGSYTLMLKRRFAIPMLTGEQKSGNEFLIKWNKIEHAKEYVVTISDKSGIIDTAVVTGTKYLYTYTQETRGKILSFTVQPRESASIYGETSDGIFTEDPQSEWTYRRNAPAALRGFGAVTVGTDIYTVGGYQEGKPDTAYKELQRYDTRKDIWETMSTCPVSAEFLVEPAVVELNGFLYVIGGLNGTGRNATILTSVYAYDLQTGTWSQCSDLPILDGSVAAAAFDGNIYCFSEPGGSGTVAVYDPRTNSWQANTHQLKNSGVHLATVVDHTVLVLKEGKGELYFQEYNPANEEEPWGAKGETMVTAHTYAGIGTVSGTMYLQENSTNRVVYYDFYRDYWGEMGSMNFPKADAKLLAVGTTLYSIGGTSEGFGTLSVVESCPVPELEILWEDLVVSKGEVYELQLGMEENLASGEITIRYDPEYLEIQRSSSFLLLEEAQSGEEGIQLMKYDPESGIIRFQFNVEEDGYFKGVYHSIPFKGLGYGKTRVSMATDKK